MGVNGKLRRLYGLNRNLNKELAFTIALGTIRVF